MSIEGIWWNNLGSRMEIEFDATDPQSFGGIYRTKVGDVPHEEDFILIGRCDEGKHPERVLSWVVVWDPPPAGRLPSITAWVGQYHVHEDTGLEFITTTWLLTRMTDATDDWLSTRVCMDFFFRTKPTSEMIKLAEEFGPAASFFSEPINPKGKTRRKENN